MRRDNTYYFVFPEYLDKSLTRKEGRRLPLSEALENPTLLEIRLAVEKLGYKYERRDNAVYPRQWWNKKGLILVEKHKPKLTTLRELSNEIKAEIRPALEEKKKDLVKKVKKRKIDSPKKRKVVKEKESKEFKPKRRR